MNVSVSNKTFFAFQGLISALKSVKQKKLEIVLSIETDTVKIFMNSS